MFTHATPSSPTLATATSPTSPVSPSRPSRLRGLSYLRSYTHSHLHSRDSSGSATSSRPFTLTRTTSYPSPTPASPNTTPASPAPLSPTPSASLTLQRAISSPPAIRDGAQEAASQTSGWLPATGGQIGASTTTVLSRTSTGATSTETMGRTRSGTAVREAGSDISQMNGGSDPQLQYDSTPALTSPSNTDNKPTIRFSQHQDVRAPRPSLAFSPMGRTLPTGKEVIKVGRYSERETQPNQPANMSTAAPVGFKSKVVSRRHCEFWQSEGTWYIKDVKSSSGTFLNHVRLSSPGTESKPFPVKDGDIVQLGIDFKGGEEMIFRCVKIRIELNRAWQNGLNSFNVASHQRLRNMAKQAQSPASSSSSQDCSICLGAVAPCQSLFVAPCSHTWHYKCVRRIINGPQWPHFVCPNCRAVADLEADVEEPTEGEWEEIDSEVLEASAATATNQIGHLRDVPEISSTPAAMASRLTTLDTAALEAPLPALPGEGIPTRAYPNVLDGLISDMDDLEIHTPPHHLHPSSSFVANLNGPVLPYPAPTTASQPIDIAPSRNSSSISRNRTAEAGSEGSGGSDDARNSDLLRTPSPSGRPRRDTGELLLSGVDGPMTPRNDAGPFVFDGSGGRVVAVGGGERS